MSKLKKIGLGGGCHWCTEAVFQSLKGVEKVEQGYISSVNEATSFSEAVIVHYDSEIISLKDLLAIHVFTHQATSDHSFREKYRSAVYISEENEFSECKNILQDLQKEFSEEIITQILPLREFKPSRESLWSYYKKDPQKPFCKKFIHPKLLLLQEKFSDLKKEN